MPRRGKEVAKGTMFGNWKVLDNIWKNGTHYCTCLCTACVDTIRDVSYKTLKNGKSISCGCITKGHDMISHVGEKHGRLYIVRDYMENKTHWCECYCDCDKDKTEDMRNLIRVRWQDIQNGSTRSCGCLQKERASESSIKDLTGYKTKFLEVLYENGRTKDGNVIWHCKCHNCGNKTDVSSHNILQGQMSCGCYRPEVPLPLHYIGKQFNKLIVRDVKRVDGVLKFTCECTCNKHTVFEVIANNVLDGHTKSCGCLAVSINGSWYENEIKNYIESISGLVGTKVNILDRKQIDLFYPQFNFGIEYNGSFFHATENSVYNNKDKNYHRDKFLLAKEKGIHLINIFDVDWKYRQDKIKMYLRNIFLEKKKIYARNCEIRKIDRKISDDFCDKYHLQNHAVMGTICYGLYYNNELYSVMVFGNVRLAKSKEGYYELHRYCVKEGYNIIGGANKLLRAFERDYNPKELLSYSDNDYFSGDIYNKLGFTYIGQSYPRYYWVEDSTLIEHKREQCRLSVLKKKYPDLYKKAVDEDAPNKENYIMIHLGACKVYRSGNTKWIKKYA